MDQTVLRTVNSFAFVQLLPVILNSSYYSLIITLFFNSNHNFCNNADAYKVVYEPREMRHNKLMSILQFVASIVGSSPTDAPTPVFLNEFCTRPQVRYSNSIVPSLPLSDPGFVEARR